MLLRRYSLRGMVCIVRVDDDSARQEWIARFSAAAKFSEISGRVVTFDDIPAGTLGEGEIGEAA